MSDSDNTDSDHIPTAKCSATDLPKLDCADVASAEQLISTPFSSPAAERFEYPFPTARMFLAAPPDSPTQVLPSGSIVPRSDTGRGMGMMSFGSLSPRTQTETGTLPYPSPTASASQAPEKTQHEGTPPPADAAGADSRRQYSAAQLCTMASARSAMPPSLVLKRRGLSVGPAGRKESSGVPDNERLTGVEGASEV